MRDDRGELARVSLFYRPRRRRIGGPLAELVGRDLNQMRGTDTSEMVVV
jgi:hypothetical protein